MTGETQTEEIKAHAEHATRPLARGARSRVPDHEIAEVRNVDFPVGMRGYDRSAVDAYVSRVNRLLAELQITAAPENAIRHALDQVTEETRGILERAHETADEITRRSRSQADDRLQLAEREGEDVRRAADEYAREIREAAEKHLASLQADAERIWQQRSQVIADMRELAGHVDDVAVQAAQRYPTRPDLDPRATTATAAAAAPAEPDEAAQPDEPDEVGEPVEGAEPDAE